MHQYRSLCTTQVHATFRMAPLYRYKLDYHAVVGLQIAKAGKHKGEIMIMLQLKEAEATVRYPTT